MGLSGSGESGELWASPTSDRSEYHEDPVSDEGLHAVEGMLGVRLPRSYVAMARLHNGGLLARTAFPTTAPTTWAPDHVAVTGIFAIGDVAPFSLCGSFGQQLWREEWGYPDLGVYFADTPSAGHDMLALDYRSCGPDGEPVVVHVDQEAGYEVTYLAGTFEAFLAGLVSEDHYLG